MKKYMLIVSLALVVSAMSAMNDNKDNTEKNSDIATQPACMGMDIPKTPNQHGSSHSPSTGYYGPCPHFAPEQFPH